MKGSQFILIGLLSILVFGSCANSEQWNNIHTVKVSVEAQSNKKHKSLSDGDTITTPPYDITVDMEFMDDNSADNADACRNINRQLIETFLNIKDTDNGEKAVKRFIKNLQNEYEQEDMAPEIYDHLTGKAEYGRDGVINYLLIEDYFGGGAHPTTTTTILRFNSSTGERIDLYGYFTDTCTTTLCNKLTKRLMEKVGVTSMDSLNARGYLENENMFVSENFALRSDSITFFYNQYDIAPYTAGCLTLSFSYDELKDCIRKR